MSEKCLKNVKTLSRRFKISHRHFSESRSPNKICTKNRNSPRGSAGVATLILCVGLLRLRSFVFFHVVSLESGTQMASTILHPSASVCMV